MAGPIRVDLEGAHQCTSMIEFLFAFYLSKDGQGVPDCNEGLLGRTFEKVKEIAKSGGTLDDELTKL